MLAVFLVFILAEAYILRFNRWVITQHCAQHFSRWQGLNCTCSSALKLLRREMLQRWRHCSLRIFSHTFACNCKRNQTQTVLSTFPFPLTAKQISGYSFSILDFSVKRKYKGRWLSEMFSLMLGKLNKWDRRRPFITNSFFHFKTRTETGENFPISFLLEWSHFMTSSTETKVVTSLSSIINNKQHHRKFLLSTFHLNGYNLGFNYDCGSDVINLPSSQATLRFIRLPTTTTTGFHFL